MTSPLEESSTTVRDSVLELPGLVGKVHRGA